VIERLATERLTLRAITLDDVDSLVDLDSDPAVMRFINGGLPTPRAEAEGIVKRSLGHRWMAFERSTDAFVGWFGLRLSDDRGRLRELGYRIRKEFWGQGLATEGARALIDAAFTTTNLERVRAETMTVNAGSRRVMEKCGLHYVRTFHLEWPFPIEGTELGDVEYELTRADWENGRD